MYNFIIKIIVYLLSFVLALYGLNGLDFNKLLKQNRVKEARILYFMIACIMAYMFANFLMEITRFK